MRFSLKGGIRKICHAGLSVAVFYTQFIGLAREATVGEYAGNLSVPVIMKTVEATAVTSGCDF